ncbi:hypothetical protein IT568_11340, partial [bacterium]|nr:hypothetical protein [bacterium]
MKQKLIILSLLLGSSNLFANVSQEFPEVPEGIVGTDTTVTFSATVQDHPMSLTMRIKDFSID